MTRLDDLLGKWKVGADEDVNRFYLVAHVRVLLRQYYMPGLVGFKAGHRE
jgi:hypothetical protein